MKSLICLLLMVTLIVGLGVSVRAGDGIVSIYTVNGSRIATPLNAGWSVRFVIRYTNNTGGKCDVSTGFRLLSPDGATWDSTTIDSVGPFSGGEWTFGKYFSIVDAFLSFSGDGREVDTVGFLGAGRGIKTTEQMPIDFDDSVIAVTAHFSNRSAAGRHICIDSAFYQPGGTWTWVDKGLNNYFPSWVGIDANQVHTPGLGYCFAISSDTTVIVGHKRRVPADYATIQAAIDASGYGDTVLVARGLYSENLNFGGKSLKLISESGAVATTISWITAKLPGRPQIMIDTVNSGKTGDYYRQLFAAVSGSPVITLPAGSDSTTLIDGFTIDGGSLVQGLTCLQSNPRIQNCVFQHCAGYWDGGGLWFQQCRPIVTKNIIRNNATPVTGGGIFMNLKDSSGTAVFSDNEFRDNIALNGAGIGIIYGRGARVVRNLLVNNDCPDISTRGGALYCGVVDSVFFVNNTIVDCKFGITLLTARNSDARNNLVARCSMNAFEQRFDNGPNTGLTFDYNLLWADGGINYYNSEPGLHDLVADPLIGSDMKLLAGSPCINRGDPASLYNDPDGSRNDIGAIPFGGNPQPSVDTLRVPSDRATIQAAIDDVRSGGVVLVSPGTYAGGLVVENKAVKIISTSGPDVTIITAPDTVDLVHIFGPDASPSVLEGFSLLGGNIGIWCLGSGPTIRHNILAYQHVTNWAAVAISGGAAPAVLINNTIVHCANGGVSTFSIEAPVLRNNIIAFNGYYGVHVQDIGLPLIAEYNDIYGNPTPYYNWPANTVSTFSFDPKLDTNNHLMIGSGCINSGDPNPLYNDPDGTRNDLGAVPFGGSAGGDPIPTNEWIILYCEHAFLGSSVLPSGAELTAYDPQGVLCGKSIVGTTGRFGPMLVYADDRYTSADEGAMPGDVINFKLDGQPIFPVLPVIWTANGALSSVCEFQSGICQQIPLHVGWNLVSWNVSYGAPIENFLTGIKNCVDIVLSYDRGGLVYLPTLPGFSTLSAVDYKHGYWIKANCETSVTVCGRPLDCRDQIDIYSGWNLVGYMAQTPYPVAQALWSLVVPNILQVVLGYDRGGLVYVPDKPGFNTLTTLNPGFGYWIRSASTSRLEGVRCEWASGKPVVTEGTETLGSRHWMSVYGSGLTLDGRALANGASVQFVTANDLVVGKSVYNDGILKFTPVYGSDEQDAATQSFPKEGDEVFAVVNGIKTAQPIAWIGDGTVQRISELTTSGGNLPREYSLSQNYPNPFNPQTTIEFSLPVPGRVRVVVYNVLGQAIKTLADADYSAGNYKLVWDGADGTGTSVASGVYFYRIEAGDYRSSRKMLLLK